jgi:catechol 2,3-dioxygenase-like lactoylglutathione lyase family enzyme
MKIKLLSVMVTDQDQALQFYTGKLGFIKKTEIPMGEHKWLTVVFPEEPDGTEIVLERMALAPARTFQQALKEAGIPATAFEVKDIDCEYDRLLKADVIFSMPPTRMGTVKLAVLDDTCGNNIQLYQIL